MKSLNCVNGECPLSGKVSAGSIIRYGFYKTESGMRHRFRCRTCGRTFCSTPVRYTIDSNMVAGISSA